MLIAIRREKCAQDLGRLGWAECEGEADFSIMRMSAGTMEPQRQLLRPPFNPLAIERDVGDGPRETSNKLC